MVDAATVRRLALAMPGAREEVSPARPDGVAFHVGPKGFAWTCMQRVAKGRPRAPRPDVLAAAWRLQAPPKLRKAAEAEGIAP